ncbi:serine/threonine-protein kinase SBK1-like [Leptodactylus fuscus]|uniref:serine/threonine-protein kinase SBK1-like n=1 Tax=Leptodactylus fuscus TaxID=238119 RepID=UPI003F4E6C1F
MVTGHIIYKLENCSLEKTSVDTSCYILLTGSDIFPKIQQPFLLQPTGRENLFIHPTSLPRWRYGRALYLQRITMDVISVFHVQDICEVFCIVKTLGEGTYGQVVLAQDYRTGTLLAAKLQRKERADRNLFLSELSLSVRLSEHPSIIRTHPIFIETPEHYILTQELAPSGTMHELIKDQVGMPEDRLKRCAVQISSALSFMHMRGLVHRDLKPDNVFLMDPECHLIKLGDFGLTRYAGSLVPMMSHIIPFMAPEICNLKSGEYLDLSASVDTWAYGVLLFVALTGYYPWEGATEEDGMYQRFRKWQQSSGLTPLPRNWETAIIIEDDESEVIVISDDEDNTASPGNPLMSIYSGNHLDIGAEVEIA